MDFREIRKLDRPAGWLTVLIVIWLIRGLFLIASDYSHWHGREEFKPAELTCLLAC